MAKAAIVYFSQGGTTARVADAIAAGLGGAGWAVDLSNLRDGPPGDLRGYDLLGLGTPVYFFRLPFNVADTLRALPRLDGMAAFIFLLHGSHAFDAVNAARRALARRGARDVGYFHCYGEAHFLGHLREGYLFSPGHPSAAELALATAFGATVARRAAEGEAVPAEAAPRPPLVYRLERALAARWLVEQVYSRLFKVDAARCTACGLCMEVCPTGNIGEDERGRPLWGRRCIYCLSCEMTCPEEAIAAATSRPPLHQLARPFLRYNVGHWAREAGLDHVRVVHRRGQTERLDGGAET